MGTLPPEKGCTHRKRAIEELIRGRDSAAQLQILFGKPSGYLGPVSADELVLKITTSFCESFSVLMSCCESCEVCEIPATTQVGSPSFGDPGSVDSGESSKRPLAAKERRGFNKRRKTSDTLMKISDTTEDGHAWRKYGQKEIHNAKFPRCYFRCTNKHDQGCLAIKQVQRIQDSPNMYKTTYFGHHTCSNISYPLNHHHQHPSQNQLLLQSDPVESILNISFESKLSDTITSQKEHVRHPSSSPPSSSASPSVKKECHGEETVQSKNNISGDLPPATVESNFWPDLMPLESSTTHVYSSTSAMDMWFFMESGHFGNEYNFSESDFLYS